MLFVCRENGGFKCLLYQPGHREPFWAGTGTRRLWKSLKFSGRNLPDASFLVGLEIQGASLGGRQVVVNARIQPRDL